MMVVRTFYYNTCHIPIGDLSYIRRVYVIDSPDPVTWEFATAVVSGWSLRSRDQIVP